MFLSRRSVLHGGAVIGATALASMCGFSRLVGPVFAQATGTPKRGGTIRYANTDTLKPLSDPATVDSPALRTRSAAWPSSSLMSTRTTCRIRISWRASTRPTTSRRGR